MSREIVKDLVARGALRVEDGNHGNDRPRPDEFVADGVAFIRAADMTSGIVDFDGAGKISDVALHRIRKGIGLPGDVILSHKGTVGRVAVAPLSAPAFVCSPQTTFWRSLDQSVIDQRYLRYVLVSSDFQRQLGVFGGQTDMAPYVSLTDQRSMEIDVPDIAEQQAIAKVLGALDDKIAANNVVAATARELARVLYDRAVRGEQNDTMSRLLTPFLGGTPSRAEAALWDGSVPWVSAKDVTGAAHGVITDTVEGISESAAKTKRLRPLPAGSVVLTARGTVGVVARLGIASAINQSCYGFVPDRVPPGCLTFVIEDASAQAMAHGSVFDTITMRTFDHVQVPALSDGEWCDVESVVAPLLAMTNQAVVESERLAATRDELLPLLMSGKVRVKDAEKTVEGCCDGQRS